MIMQKLSTIVRSSVRESSDRIIDANAIRIFEQEICDVEAGMRKAKANLTLVVAEKIKLERQIMALQESIAKKESQALQALDKNADKLARQLAQSIAEDESELAAFENGLQSVQKQESVLGHQIKTALRRIQMYRRELTLAKTMDRSQEASKTLHQINRHMDLTGSQLDESLQRIKQKQQMMNDQLTAANVVDELLNNDLTEELKAKDIGSENKAAAVLKRLKQKAKTDA